MRRIAFNDPKPFLTTEQIEAVNSKINQLKGSRALAENFKAVKKDAAQFASLANSKNLKPAVSGNCRFSKNSVTHQAIRLPPRK